MWYEYKGQRILKTFRYGYTYWKIAGQKRLFSTMKEAKFWIDKEVEA